MDYFLYIYLSFKLFLFPMHISSSIWHYNKIVSDPKKNVGHQKYIQSVFWEGDIYKIFSSKHRCIYSLKIIPTSYLLRYIIFCVNLILTHLFSKVRIGITSRAYWMIWHWTHSQIFWKIMWDKRIIIFGNARQHSCCCCFSGSYILRVCTPVHVHNLIFINLIFHKIAFKR